MISAEEKAERKAEKLAKEKENLIMLEDVLLHYGGIEVKPIELYREMYKVGEGEIQSYKQEVRTLQANPLVYMRNKWKRRGKYRILFEDQLEEILDEAYTFDFAITNGISYFGRKNVQQHASKMYAMIFDLDGVEEKNLLNFFHAAAFSEQMTNDSYIYPTPNYVVLSGHGVHLYYLFDWPIPLYPNIKLQLKNLKYALTRKMWNQYTSNIKKPQYQGINQGFRVAGSKTKIDGYRSKAFKFRSRPWTLRELGEYVPEKYRVDENALFRESKLSLEEAKKRFPDWYQRIVVDKEPPHTWKNKRDLYDWWFKRIKSEATFGHRYFCIMMLAIYAIKSGVSLDEVRKDALSLLDDFNEINPLEPFTKADIESALECYDFKYKTFPIKDIVKLTNIQIYKNKRNGRTQEMHLRGARAICEINNPDWRNKDGRPKGSGTKQELIQEWRAKHPEGKKIDCHRETGMSRVTIDKWWG